MTDSREKPRSALEEFAQLPFPAGSADEDAAALHAELAEYDAYVAGLVTSLVGHGIVEQERLRSDTAVRQRMEEVAQRSGPTSSDVGRYLAYLDRLDHLLAVARTV